MPLFEVYLGDGVYASHDGYQVWLRTERDGRPVAIALEPAVMERLIRFDAAVRDGRQSISDRRPPGA